MQALVNQKQGAKQGNPNPTYYKLAAAEYGSSGSTTCNSSKGNTAATSCTFYDVTLGDMDVDCTGTHNCYKPSGTYGVLVHQQHHVQQGLWDSDGLGLLDGHRHAKRG